MLCLSTTHLCLCKILQRKVFQISAWSLLTPLLSHLPFILLSLVTMTDPNPSLLKETRKPSCCSRGRRLRTVETSQGCYGILPNSLEYRPNCIDLQHRPGQVKSSQSAIMDRRNNILQAT
jgi:hypothetical protein